METIWRDLCYGLRTLARKPGFTVVAILSLAIGIGANSAIFSVINSLLFRPLPFSDADRLMILWNRSPGLNIAQDWLSPGEYVDIKNENQVFEEVACTIDGSFNLTGDGLPEHVDGARVSSSLFPLLGANAAEGRVFLTEEDEPGKPQTVILSHGFWERRFGSDRDVIGRALNLNGNNFTIVGIMPREFSLGKEVMPTVNGIKNAEILLPLPMSQALRATRTHEDYNIFGKLKPSVTVAQAQADLDAIVERMKERYPESYPPNSGFTISAVPLLQQVVGDIRRALVVLLGAVTFVLLIACANVANLLLSRASIREKEIAIRTAVGASRRRILGQLLTESVLLSLFGGIAGLAVAFVAVKALRIFGPQSVPRLNEIGIDLRVAAFTFLVSLITGVIFGLVPALRASRVDLNEVLKDGGRGSVGAGVFAGGHHRVRNLLVIAEVALSLILLIGAGLLIRSYQRIQDANPGFNPHNVLSLRLSLPAVRYSKPEAVSAFYKQLCERVKALPGVESVGTNYSLPMSSVALAWGPITVEGYVSQTAQDSIIANERFVSPEYFNVMRVPLVSGRYFDERDVKGAMETVIVNEEMAERFWPGESPLGKHVRPGSSGPWRTVVGVIRDTKHFSVDNEPSITIYLSSGQFPIGTLYLVVRTTSDPARMTEAITGELRTMDAELPVYDVRTMDQRLFDSLARRRFSMLLLGAFAAFALILAAIGVYGVISYSVNQRTHEFGIRMALGARQSNILRLVIRNALMLISVGVSLGLAGAFALTRLMSSLLFNTGAADPFTFAAVSTWLVLVAILASYLPARRAARVDPMIALRYE